MSKFYKPMPANAKREPLYADLTPKEIKMVEAFIHGMTIQSKIVDADVGLLLERLLHNCFDLRTRIAELEVGEESGSEPVAFCAECTTPIYDTDTWRTFPDGRSLCAGCADIDSD